MFVKAISNLTLTNEIGDRLFDNITGSTYALDNTFTATLRAVLHGRLPANETINLTLIPVGNSLNAVRFTSTTDVLRGVANLIEQNDTSNNYSISIVHPQDKHIGNQLLDIVRADVGEGKQYFSSYAIQEDLRIFYIKNLNGLFYTNGYSTIIFLDYMDMRRFHVLQMMIPKYLPRLFANNTLSNEETSLLKSLGLRSHNEYETLIEQFALKMDMRNEMIRTRLKGFEIVYERKRVQEVSAILDTHREEYQKIYDSLNKAASFIREQEIILAGLESMIEDSHESEIMEYFLCNKNLSVIRVSGTELEFVVHSYVDSYDEDAFDTYVNNPKSYLFKQTIGNASAEIMERFYRAIFSEGIYKLRVCAAYRANMNSSIYALTQYIFPPECHSYIPNPHIQVNGCTGSYGQRFIEYMKNRDYVGALDLASISARNLNFHDSGVISRFIKTLSSTPIRCIEDTDGTLMTPKQAIRRLEEVEGCQSQ